MPDVKTAVPPDKMNQLNPITIVDTEATSHCLDTAAESSCIIEVQCTKAEPFVQVTNGKSVETKERAIVPGAKELSTEAKVGHIFNSLKLGVPHLHWT